MQSISCSCFCIWKPNDENADCCQVDKLSEGKFSYRNSRMKCSNAPLTCIGIRGNSHLTILHLSGSEDGGRTEFLCPAAAAVSRELLRLNFGCCMVTSSLSSARPRRRTDRRNFEKFKKKIHKQSQSSKKDDLNNFSYFLSFLHCNLFINLLNRHTNVFKL